MLYSRHNVAVINFIINKVYNFCLDVKMWVLLIMSHAIDFV